MWWGETGEKEGGEKAGDTEGDGQRGKRKRGEQEKWEERTTVLWSAGTPRVFKLCLLSSIGDLRCSGLYFGWVVYGKLMIPLQTKHIQYIQLFGGQNYKLFCHFNYD